MNRPELIERFGYDTKYAMHALRLGFQGTEISTEARLSLPMQDHHRAYPTRCPPREGVTRTTWWSGLEELETTLGSLLEDGSVLGDEPDIVMVNGLLGDLYRTHWGWSSTRPLSPADRAR